MESYYTSPAKTSKTHKLFSDRVSLSTRSTSESPSKVVSCNSSIDLKFNSTIVPFRTSLTRQSSIMNDSMSRCESDIFMPSPPTLKSLVSDGQARMESVEHKLIRLEKQEARCRKFQSRLTQDITSQYDKYIQVH